MAKIKKKDLKAWIEEQRRRINNTVQTYPYVPSFYAGQLAILCELRKYLNLEDEE